MSMDKNLANISRAFLKEHKVYRYRLKKIADMLDDEVIVKCHWFCEENNLVQDFKQFREEKERYLSD